MPGKKNLDDMLAQGGGRPAIRRGQGIRLSTDVPPDAPSTSAPSLPPQQEHAEEGNTDESAQVHNRTSAQAHKLESTQEHKLQSAQVHESVPPPSRTRTTAAPERVTRVSQGQRLRADLVKQLKRIAVEEDRKLYEVMEEALEQYIERHQQNST